MSKQVKIGLEEIAAVHSGPSTLYHSLGHIIRGKIQSGEWSVGQRIPSERQMVEIFNVSRSTVRQGIDYLVKEGVLRREQGRGTFVAPPKIEQGVLRLMEFSDIIKRSGLVPSFQMIGEDLIVPPPNVQKLLRLHDLEQVVWFQRLILVNEEPMILESSYFSSSRFPGLLESYEGTAEPHKFVCDYYDIKVTRARETFEPVILEDKEAGLLGVKGGFPALWVQHIAYDAGGEPALFLTSLMRGDRCRFFTDLVFENG